jgi:hypothetical protein
MIRIRGFLSTILIACTVFLLSGCDFIGQIGPTDGPICHCLGGASINDGEASRDITTEIAMTEEAALHQYAKQVSDKFSLSEDSLVEEAAKNFETTPENMKNLLKALHGKALEQQGIKL